MLQRTPPKISDLVDTLRREIETGVRPGASRLPSIRSFAREKSASRYAVVEAYDRLAASGYIVSRPGAGFFVSARRKRSAQSDKPAPRQGQDVAHLIRDVLESGDHLLKLGGPWLPDEWLDTDAMQSIVRSLGRGPVSHLLHYGLPKGYLPLRDQLQLGLRGIGIEADCEQVVLTHGSSHAFDLIIRRLLQPGDTVLVEDPGYYNLFGYLRHCGMRLIGVPRRTDGPDIAALRAAAAQYRPKLFFVQSSLQNPTGTDIPPQGLYRILQAAAEFDFRIVEDDTYGDLTLSAHPRLATLDQLDRVIYVKSFSKTLSGSMRVGMLATSHALADEMTGVKILSSISTSEFVERFVYGMLVEGHYRKFIERLNVRLANARAYAQGLLAKAGMDIFALPAGGNFFWARFPHIADSETLVPAARKLGIILGAGKAFRPNLEPSPWMRINVTLCNDQRVHAFLDAHRLT